MTREPVPSPCVSVCRMNDALGFCEGCLRTLDEIAAWSVLDDDGKRAVWIRLGERRAALVAPSRQASPSPSQESPR